jgi:hypothetical protein
MGMLVPGCGGALLLDFGRICLEFETGRSHSLTIPTTIFDRPFLLRRSLNSEPHKTIFAITGSRDGVNGLYWTDVFIINQPGLTKISLSQVIWHAFGHPVRCGWPEDPNVGAIKWIDGSSKLLVAAEIIGHSNCDSYFTFKAYEIEVPTQKILRSTLVQIKAAELSR